MMRKLSQNPTATRSLIKVPMFRHHCSRNRNAASALSQSGQPLEDETMKLAIAWIAAAGICLAIPAANAEDRVGVGVGPVGAGVTVGESHDRDRDRDRTTVIKEREPRDRTTVIRKDREDEPHDRTTIIKKQRDY
jgi:hypothetical protein